MTSKHVHTAVGVLGLIVDTNKRILLILSKDRGWEPPMGFMDANESPVPALRREILEESGFEVAVLRLTGIYHCTREIPILSLCFLCAPVEIVSLRTEESLDMQWVSLSKLDDIVTYKPHLLRIKDALDGPPSRLIFREYVIDPFSIKKSWIL
jgi:8-oxo-dGTP diphosphatase